MTAQKWLAGWEAGHVECFDAGSDEPRPSEDTAIIFINGGDDPAITIKHPDAPKIARVVLAGPDMRAALVAIEAALRKDSRQKTIIGDEVEYHLDGQTMGYAINLARAAIAKAGTP